MSLRSLGKVCRYGSRRLTQTLAEMGHLILYVVFTLSCVQGSWGEEHFYLSSTPLNFSNLGVYGLNNIQSHFGSPQRPDDYDPWPFHHPPYTPTTMAPWEYVSEASTTVDTPEGNHGDLLPAESPIGYEAECGVRSSDANRIVGGSAASSGEFPWQVSLQLKTQVGYFHTCGGAVISKYWVVSAGHCVDGLKPYQLSILSGSHDLETYTGNEQRRNVVKIVTKGYEATNYINDISLLQLDQPLLFDGVYTAPVCVPRRGREFSGMATVTGWGRLSEGGTKPKFLQRVTVPKIANHRCEQFYQSTGFQMQLNSCQMCYGYEQGGKDSCQGDSGGPLVCPDDRDGRFYLCGVVSWGVGCARPQLPGVYTKVSCFADWVHDVLYNV